MLHIVLEAAKHAKSSPTKPNKFEASGYSQHFGENNCLQIGRIYHLTVMEIRTSGFESPSSVECEAKLLKLQNTPTRHVSMATFRMNSLLMQYHKCDTYCTLNFHVCV